MSNVQRGREMVDLRFVQFCAATNSGVIFLSRKEVLRVFSRSELVDRHSFGVVMSFTC